MPKRHRATALLVDTVMQRIAGCVLLTALATPTPASASVPGDLIFINGFNGCPAVYPDADGDYHGVSAGAIVSCTPGPGYAAHADDCDDTDASVHPGAVDVPDADFRDQNCDGIDGDIARAAFVASAGVDTGDCRINAPCASIGFALGVAAQDPSRDQVYIAAGNYPANVELVSGHALFGGFDNNWLRASRTQPGHVVTIFGTVHAHNVSGPAGPILENLVVASADEVAPGTSSSGVVFEQSSAMTLARVSIAAGAGAAGNSMPPAGSVDGGGDGGAGSPGCENSTMLCKTCDSPPVGPAGTSTCGHDGGAGGAPGLGPHVGSGGADGFEGMLGGPGATCYGATSCNGTTGTSGTAGAAGTSGDGGVQIGTFSGVGYVPAAGANGTSGSPGQGGGGGGGGGGGTNACDSYGSSGGGGGGGGCGGNPGTGGQGGGGSFGIVLLDSSATLVDSIVATSTGGSGGAGGQGSVGGTGGAAGPGGLYGGINEQDDGGNGADGGRGGDGGGGGHGGGGGGGPSIAIVCLGTSSIVTSGTTLQAGNGGPGGTSSGSGGAAGLASATYGCGP